MPEDMITQIPVLKEVVRAYNIPVVELDGFEADDIIGTLAKQAERENALTFLVTPDKDFMQLVSDTTKIYKPGKYGSDIEIVDIEGVRQKFGVTPDKVIDVLGLIGDASDNIPGVPGVARRLQFRSSRSMEVSKNCTVISMIFLKKAFALNWNRTKIWQCFPSNSLRLISMYRFLSIFIRSKQNQETFQNLWNCLKH